MQQAQIIKCHRCSFRGLLTEFPQKNNLQYLKVCFACKEKRAEKLASKRGEDTSNKENVTRNSHGKNTSLSGPPLLPWDTFIALLAQNKDQAFELHAFVKLQSVALFEDIGTGHKVAVAIATSVRQATGFRFKYVAPFFLSMAAKRHCEVIKRTRKVARLTRSSHRRSTVLN